MYVLFVWGGYMQGWCLATPKRFNSEDSADMFVSFKGITRYMILPYTDVMNANEMSSFKAVKVIWGDRAY